MLGACLVGGHGGRAGAAAVPAVARRRCCRRLGELAARRASSPPTPAISIYRISVGFLISTALALPIGILIGCYRTWEAAIEPLVDFIRYMPVVAFVPLTILWAGTGDTQKFLIIFIGTFFQQVLLVMDNVKSVPRDFIDLGRTLEMPERRILQRIVLPSAMPAIWDSLRISLGWAWTWLVVAELVAATSGLGYRITTAQRFFQTDPIFGYLLLLGILGLATDQAMKFAGRRLFRYLRCADDRAQARHRRPRQDLPRPTAATTVALAGVDLDVGENEFVALVGTSGLRQVHAALHRRRPRTP